MSVVHVRLTPTVRLCGATRGESMSLAFVVEHVAPNRIGCCRRLWLRLCPECDRRLPSVLQETRA